MAYLLKKYRVLLEKIDRDLKLPTGWNSFVKKETEKHSLIIKTKGKCTCCNCNTEFKSKKKINDVEKCPKCKGEYLIKRSNYKWHEFEPRRLVLLDKLEDRWIIRLFEIHSNYRNGKMHHTGAIEYGRVDVSNDLNFVNNRVYCGMYGTEKVRTYEDIKSWRLYHSGYRKLSVSGKLFYKNLKELFKETEYKYSQLWTLAKKEDNIDIIYYLKNNLPGTEFLIKMGLYKLALCPKTFNKKGCFENRFGINKEYYYFMKKYNLDIDELSILKLYKKKNIERIKYLKQFKQHHLDKISKYMSLDTFIEFAQNKERFDIGIYSDYIGFLEDLELDLKNKKYLFPDDIKLEHDKYQAQVEVRGDEIIKKRIAKRYKELQRNIFSNNIYLIKPAGSIKELEDESKQQKNCVRTYAKKYSRGDCDIYFMREKNKPDTSLVTVEVNNNRIVQSRTKCNNSITKIQKRFLDKWEETILNAA